jgi:hypothetical protein
MYDDNEEEVMFICETLEQMQVLYQKHLGDQTIQVKWYHTDAFNDTVLVS